MTIQFNGSAVNSVVFNGVAYTNVYMNGVKVLGVVRNLTVGKYSYGDYYGFNLGSYGTLTNRTGSPIGDIVEIDWALPPAGSSTLFVRGTIAPKPPAILLTLNGVTRELTLQGGGIYEVAIPYEEAHATLPTSGTYPIEIEVPL